MGRAVYPTKRIEGVVGVGAVARYGSSLYPACTKVVELCHESCTVAPLRTGNSGQTPQGVVTWIHRPATGIVSKLDFTHCIIGIVNGLFESVGLEMERFLPFIRHGIEECRNDGIVIFRADDIAETIVFE